MSKQYSLLPLIPRRIETSTIDQRATDGYINATAMCQAASKLFADYRRLSSTDEFLAELSSDMGNPITELIQSVRGGDPSLQGTWVHPNVAIHLAQWLSPKFAVQVAKWVHEWISGGLKSQSLPDFVRRYHLNSDRVSPGHFSVIGELFIRVYGRLEAVGYKLPDKGIDGRRMRPDNSVGRLFSPWLSRSYPEISDQFSYYPHQFPNDTEFQARQYKNIVWPYFIQFIDEVWIPDHAERYFSERDPEAVGYIPLMLAPPKK